MPAIDEPRFKSGREASKTLVNAAYQNGLYARVDVSTLRSDAVEVRLRGEDSPPNEFVTVICTTTGYKVYAASGDGGSLIGHRKWPGDVTDLAIRSLKNVRKDTNA